MDGRGGEAGPGLQAGRGGEAVAPGIRQGPVGPLPPFIRGHWPCGSL